MGLEVAAIVMAGVAVGSKIGQMEMENKAANAKEAALDLQSKQQTVAYQQKTLSNYDVMEKVLDAQTAAQTVKGTAFSSPSFNAIQRNTVNIGAKRQKNLDIEHNLAEENIEIEKQNVKDTLYAQLFGDVSSLAMSGLSFASGMPTKSSAPKK